MCRHMAALDRSLCHDWCCLTVTALQRPQDANIEVGFFLSLDAAFAVLPLSPSQEFLAACRLAALFSWRQLSSPSLHLPLSVGPACLSDWEVNTAHFTIDHLQLCVALKQAVRCDCCLGTFQLAVAGGWDAVRHCAWRIGNTAVFCFV